MLSIIFNRGTKDIEDANYVFSPDTYFKYNYEEEWFEDELVKEMVQDVDSSVVMSAHAIESPVFGIIAPERLSGGVKALIIMYKEPNLIVNASACGNNCAKWILEIGRRQDITIRLGYEMEFSEPFDICVKNSGNVIHNYFEFLKEFQEVETEVNMKCFNTAGICIPENNYMADVSDKVGQIVDQYISSGKYFTINRARQYGKTTTLYLLEERLKKDYIVLSLSFESADELFASLYTLAAGLIRKIGRILKVQGIPENICVDWQQPISKEFPLDDLGQRITELCSSCDKGVVLLIDEVDKSSDNQIFLSFLGLLREKYLNRLKGQEETFHSVILAGVYDVKNLKLKLHPGAESKYNSPWNIAVDFEVDMSLSVEEITSMLQDYESDWHTGMDIAGMSEVLYEYTSGYPFLVSRLCQIMAQEQGTCWNRQTFQNAVRELLRVSNSLFDDMGKKLAEYPELKEMVYGILFQGKKYAYESENHRIRIGEMFGFLKESQGTVSISNRIFEMKLYNLLLSEVETDGRIFATAEMEKNQFVKDGSLQMELVMEKFCEYFEEIYADADDKFVEENGRRIFLMFLKPIINGSGNYYIEARTRNLKRTDVIIDYKGEQSVLELKIWHGQEYNSRGEKQLTEYLEYYHLKKGYMLSFNFNQKKQTGIRRIVMGEKLLIEAVV